MTVNISTTGAALIVAERFRQVLEEGYNPEHDAQHGGQDLVDAAIAYAVPSAERKSRSRFQPEVPEQWPWERESWKPTPDDRVRELVKAGALIAAAIDVLLASGDEERRADA